MKLKLASILEPDATSRLRALFRVNATDAAHVARGKRFLQLLALVTLVGVVAWATAFFKGHQVMGTTSEVPWGILIATYIFFVGASTGAGLVSALGHVFGVKLFEPLAKKATFVSLLTLMIGFLVIASELERPLLLAAMAVISPNLSSPIWWMGALYALESALITAELYFLLVDDHRRARFTGLASLLIAVAAFSNLGAVFGSSHARPYWAGPFVSIYFIATALMAGAAVLILIAYWGDYFSHDRTCRPETAPLLAALRKLLALFLGIVAFFTAWRLIIGIQGEHYGVFEVTMAHVAGPMFVSFWLFEVFLGLAVPLWIVLGSKRQSPGFLALGATLLLSSMLVMRYNFVYSGQMFSLRPLVGRMGERVSYAPPFKGNVAGFLPYTPSIVEVLVVVGALAGAIVLSVVGLRVLRLQAQAEET